MRRQSIYAVLKPDTLRHVIVGNHPCGKGFERWAKHPLILLVDGQEQAIVHRACGDLQLGLESAVCTHAARDLHTVMLWDDCARLVV